MLTTPGKIRGFDFHLPGSLFEAEVSFKKLELNRNDTVSAVGFLPLHFNECSLRAIQAIKVLVQLAASRTAKSPPRPPKAPFAKKRADNGKLIKPPLALDVVDSL
nr:hypothetical protein [Shimia thalassica]